MGISETQIKKQRFWTDGCYRHALLEVYADSIPKDVKRGNANAIRFYLIAQGKNVHSPEVGSTYIKNILKMTSDRLQIILQAHELGRPTRVQTTVDAIMNELFERSVNPETREKHE